jgi:hypothetical protein
VEDLNALEKYDLAIIAKPTEMFSDAEKQVLDQFIINGGKTLWLVEQVNVKWTVSTMLQDLHLRFQGI